MFSRDAAYPLEDYLSRQVSTVPFDLSTTFLHSIFYQRQHSIGDGWLVALVQSPAFYKGHTCSGCASKRNQGLSTKTRKRQHCLEKIRNERNYGSTASSKAQLSYHDVVTGTACQEISKKTMFVRAYYPFESRLAIDRAFLEPRHQTYCCL